MLDVEEINLIKKFLVLNYPVKRIKINMRFRRTIIVNNDEIFVLGDKTSTKRLYYSLLDILNIVFSFEEKTMRDVLRVFLNLKDNY